MPSRGPWHTYGGTPRRTERFLSSWTLHEPPACRREACEEAAMTADISSKSAPSPLPAPTMCVSAPTMCEKFLLGLSQDPSPLPASRALLLGARGKTRPSGPDGGKASPQAVSASSPQQWPALALREQVSSHDHRGHRHQYSVSLQKPSQFPVCGVKGRTKRTGRAAPPAPSTVPGLRRPPPRRRPGGLHFPGPLAATRPRPRNGSETGRAPQPGILRPLAAVTSEAGLRGQLATSGDN
ncbi:uncharacterized protein LOC143660644 isoform X2 [Tamandua tetradactyla]|uniref:uncharacterized protein LOC143660644 isoform X2 n=1 Tax=Tamandua tetradactyla TaxID=48850 RepID=UPI004053C4B4